MWSFGGQTGWGPAYGTGVWRMGHGRGRIGPFWWYRIVPRPRPWGVPFVVLRAARGRCGGVSAPAPPTPERRSAAIGWLRSDPGARQQRPVSGRAPHSMAAVTGLRPVSVRPSVFVSVCLCVRLSLPLSLPPPQSRGRG